MPSESCSGAICLQYCRQPGWWTVDEVCQAIEAGYARRMMLEISPEQTVGVLSPAFKGCEGFFGLQEYSANGCTFLENDFCQLFGSGVQPLECRFCPEAIDCRPIFVQQALAEVGFQVLDVQEMSIWGLSVEIVLARRT